MIVEEYVQFSKEDFERWQGQSNRWWNMLREHLTASHSLPEICCPSELEPPSLPRIAIVKIER